MTRSGHGVRWVVGLVTAWGLGCGGGSGGGTSSLATAQGFCAQSNAVWAANSLRCAGGTLADWNSDAYCAKVGAARANIQYDATAAESCLATLQAMSATTCDPEPDCLAQVNKGLVPDGQPCTINQECATAGSLCIRADATMCAPLLCTGLSPVGGSCDPLGCAAPAACDTKTNTCVAGVYGDLGATCSYDPTMLCKDGLDCEYVGNATTGTCQMAPPTPTPPACQSDFDCNVFYEFCDTTCKPRIAEGQPCTDHPMGCQVLTVCDAVTNRCSAAGHIGQACGGFVSQNGSFEYCAAGYCDSSDANAPVCKVFKGLGAACASPGECKSGVCHNSVCTDCPR